MNEIKEKLKEEILTKLEALEDTEPGSNADKALVDEVTRLTDRFIELEKIDVDAAAKAHERVFDQDQKRKQLEEQIKAREAEVALKTKQLEEEIRGRDAEFKLKVKQANEETKSRWIGWVMKLVEIGVPLGVAVRMTYRSWDFEKTGVVTTFFGKIWQGSIKKK